jgi:D-glycero-alpha-D-manno-heptose 1-phosphate guanylyltransferase
LFQTHDAKRYLGGDLDDDARLHSLVGATSADEVWANGGVYMISPGVLDPLAARFEGEVSLEGQIFPAVLARGAAMYGLRHHGRFIDIGLPADYRRAASILLPATQSAGDVGGRLPHG